MTNNDSSGICHRNRKSYTKCDVIKCPSLITYMVWFGIVDITYGNFGHINSL